MTVWLPSIKKRVMSVAMHLNIAETPVSAFVGRCRRRHCMCEGSLGTRQGLCLLEGRMLK